MKDRYYKRKHRYGNSTTEKLIYKVTYCGCDEYEYIDDRGRVRTFISQYWIEVAMSNKVGGKLL